MSGSDSEGMATANRVASPDAAYLLRERNRPLLRGQSATVVTSNHRVFLTIGLVALFVCGLIGAAIVSAWLVEGRLQSNGVIAPGTIIDASVRQESSGPSGRSSHAAYYLRYNFSAPGPSGAPTAFMREQSTTQGIYGHYPKGAKVNVRYLPGDPTNSQLAGPDFEASARKRNISFATVMVLLAAFPLALLVPGIGGTLRDRRFARTGRILDARIVSVAYRRRLLPFPRATITFVFHSPTGSELQGNATPPLSFGASPAEGQASAVVYLHDTLFRLL